MPRIYVCGEALIDFVPVTSDSGSAYLPKPGGSPFNAAKAAALAGADVSFLGGLSTDLFGDQMVAELTAHGVDATLAPRSADPTTLAFVDFATGDPRYAFFNNGTATAKMAPDANALRPEPGDILDIGSVSLIDLPGADNITGFAQALSDRMMLAIDPNARPSMIEDRLVWDARMATLFDAAAIIKISSEDLEYIHPGLAHDAFAQIRIDAGTALVMVTDGANGARAWTRSGSSHVPTPQVTLADTVGAGDTFMGNALAWIQRKGVNGPADLAALGPEALTELLQIATMAAAINCTRIGCMPPKLSDVTAALG